MSVQTMSRRCCLLTVTLALGCSSSPENIGDGELDVDKAKLESYAASWDGYVEAYHFQSGTDRVHVTLDANGNGSFVVGDGALLAPPTDPNLGYPAALATDVLARGFLDQTSTLYDGIAYPVVGTRIESERIRLAFDPHSAFTEWCEMQTPALDPNTTPTYYGCAPNGWNQDQNGCTVFITAVGEPIDCGKLVICNSGCDCDASSCTSKPSHTLVELDAALDDGGHNLVGTLLANGQPWTLRLKR